MYQVNINQRKHVVLDVMNTFLTLPIAVGNEPDYELQALIADLSPSTPWGIRKSAAERIGNLRVQAALPALLTALPRDPFWMVRCAIIQALEKLGDPRSIPTLQEVAELDSFQVVRSYAAKAIKRLSIS